MEQGDASTKVKILASCFVLLTFWRMRCQRSLRRFNGTKVFDILFVVWVFMSQPPLYPQPAYGETLLSLVFFLFFFSLSCFGLFLILRRSVSSWSSAVHARSWHRSRNGGSSSSTWWQTCCTACSTRRSFMSISNAIGLSGGSTAISIHVSARSSS